MKYLAIATAVFAVSLVTMQCGEDSISESNVIWREDFDSDSLGEWTVVDLAPREKSDWHIYEGYLVHTSNIGGAERLGSHIVAGDAGWRDYTVRSEFVSTDDDYIGILFRYRDAENYYRFYVPGQNGQIFLEKRVNGKIVKLAAAEEPLEFCKMTLAAAVRRDRIRVYLNDREYFNLRDDSHPAGKVGLMTCYNEGAYFDNITVSAYHKIREQHKPARLERRCGPYLQNVLGDSATIMWQTNLPSGSVVEYGLENEPKNRIKATGMHTVHEVRLHGLKPGAQYFYRVISDTLVSDWYSLRRLPVGANKFRFALYGDSQNNFIVHKKIAAQMAGHRPDFIVSVGDLAHGGRRADWTTEFFSPMRDMLSKTPVYVSVGNHAYGSPHFTEYFDFPESSHETYYSIQVGNAYFIFLDNAITAFPDKEYYTDIKVGSPQYKWLVKELSSPAAQNAEWLFVVAHVPCYSEYSDVDYPENVKSFVPLYKRYHVDAVFSGHIHVYERGVADGVCYVISGGSGGRPDRNKFRDIDEIQVTRTGHHFCIVDIEGRKMTLNQYDIDGVLRDSFSIDKTKKN